VKGAYEVHHEDMISYHHATTKLADSFDGFYISHVSGLLNTKADVLAALAATLALSANPTYHLTIATRHLFCPKYGLEVSEVHTTTTNFESKDWRLLIIDNALNGKLPDDPKKVASVRQRSTRFYYNIVVKMLYHHLYNGTLFRCLSNLEAREVLKEAHDGISRPHQPSPKIKDQLH